MCAPLCIKIAFALIRMSGILFFPFSQRWLMGRGRKDEALQVLSKLRRLPENHHAISF